MAARKRKGTKDNKWQEETRQRIKSSMLINRLENYALSEKDPQGNDVELNSGRVRAIEILLNKTLPNLQATELTGPDGGPVIPVLNVTGK